MRGTYDDTIVAISTPAGTGGLAVLRLSGPAALQSIKPYFDRSGELQPRLAVFGRLKHPDLADTVFDECILTYFEAPHSATGEDVVEMSIHGGEYLQAKLLGVLAKEPGLRLADAGEFTLRAFLNGRMDLTRAEAVSDLIHSRDAASHRNAQHQLHGKLSTVFDSFRKTILAMVTHIEAELDFSDQEIDFVQLNSFNPELEQLNEQSELLLQSYFYGRQLREGLRVPIIGAPNAGKSTLFNSLVGMDRAIVTEQPGTTRDTIEDTIFIGDHRIILVDTAGIRSTEDQTEKSGVSRAMDELSRADIIIEVSSPDTNNQAMKNSSDTPSVTVFNKADLAGEPSTGGMLEVSALSGSGLQELKDRLAVLISDLSQTSSEGIIVSTQRHVNVLERFQEQVLQCQAAINDTLGPEYVAADLRQALHILGEITGETTPDEILDQIFSGFCIGK